MQTSRQEVQRSAFLLLSVCAVLVGVCLTLYEGSTSHPMPEPLVTRINPNTASLGQLQTLPGIGPARAKAIVLYRETHLSPPAFASLEDLTQVHGLGPALVRELASWLCLDETPAK